MIVRTMKRVHWVGLIVEQQEVTEIGKLLFYIGSQGRAIRKYDTTAVNKIIKRNEQFEEFKKQFG